MSPHTNKAAAPDAPEPLTRMELVISHVLRIGVLLSAAVILAGVLQFAWSRDTGYARLRPHHLTDLIAYHPKTGPGVFPTALSDVLRGAVEERPYAIVGLGLVLLIATPIVRVALSIFFFLSQRDWLYTGITLLVFCILLLSLLTGIG